MSSRLFVRFSLLSVILILFSTSLAFADRIRFKPGQGQEVPYQWKAEQITVTEGDSLTLILERKNTDNSSAYIYISDSLELFITPELQSQAATAGEDFSDVGYKRINFSANGAVERSYTLDFLQDNRAEGDEYMEIVIVEVVGALATQPYRRVSIRILDDDSSSMPEPSADFNCDGQVDALDLNILGVNWLGSGDYSKGDANGDGSINSLDLNVLGVQWLTSVNSDYCPL